MSACSVLLSFQQIVGDPPVPGDDLLLSYTWAGETLQPTRKLKRDYDGHQAASPRSDHIP